MFGLDNTVKSKPVLGVDDLLLLVNHHWAQDTSTFSTEQHWVQFVLILLLLFGTGYRPAELVDTKKNRKDNTSFDDDLEVVDDDDILVVDKVMMGFNAENNKVFNSYDKNALKTMLLYPLITCAQSQQKTAECACYIGYDGPSQRTSKTSKAVS